MEPAVGKPLRKNCSQLGAKRVGVSRFLEIAKGSADFPSGSEIERDRLRRLPVRRNLQDGRAAQPAMRDEHFFAKLISAAGSDYFGGNSSEITITQAVPGI